MDIPFIDDSCASDGSLQQMEPSYSAPLRISRYSESSDDVVDKSSGQHGDDVSVNNLLDELADWSAGEVDRASGDLYPAISPSGYLAFPSGVGTPTHNGSSQATESGYSDRSGVPTQERAEADNAPPPPPRAAAAGPGGPYPGCGLAVSGAESGIDEDEPDAGPAGSLVQQVLSALSQPSFGGHVRVEGSSDVVLGPVVNIHVPRSKGASPFSSISKASRVSSLSSSLERVPPSRQDTLRGHNNPLVARIVAYLRTRCLDTLTRLKPIPWCAEFRLPLQQYFITLSLAPVSAHGDQSHLPVRLEDILSPLTTQEVALPCRPRRILVEGEPGFGKSTLALKVLHDWACDDAPPYLSAFQFAFLIPLWEFSGSLFNFTHRELLPRHIVDRDLMARLWQYLVEHEERVLFLLDGLDELRDEHRPQIVDLLAGKLFLNSTVVVTSRPSHAAEALPWVHRRLVIRGFEPPDVGRYLGQYFSCVRRPDGSVGLLAELQRRPALRELARCPLLCLLLCVVFEDRDGVFPESEALLYRTLFECLIRRSLLRRGERLEDDELPPRCLRLLRQFGKIALQLCLEDRVYYTSQEIVNHVADREVFDWGFLTRVVSVSKVQKKEIYQPLHRTFTDFLAAYYLASMPDLRSLRQQMAPVLTHLERLDRQPKASHGVMVMLRYLVALLNDGQRRAFQALELLGPLGLAPRTLFSLLRAAGDEKLAAQAVAVGLASQQHVLVQTDQPAELEGWARVLHVSAHQESLEVVFRPGCCAPALGPLLAVAARRLRLVKLGALLGTDMSGDELRYMGQLIGHLLRPDGQARLRLRKLHISLQNLDDSDFVRFQPVVEALCAALPLVPAATALKLELDLDMSAMQMCQLCAALQRSRGVAVLSINHLVLLEGSMAALAGLLRVHPLSALVLRGVWQPEQELSSARDFFRAEHRLRASVGGGGQLRGASLTRNYSLGRGAAGSGEMELAFRLRLGREPICDSDSHVGGFHQVFDALRTPGCLLCSLKLSRCRLTAADLACLGESLRAATHLTSLTVEHVSQATDLVPLLFALQENTRLQLLDLTSSSMVIEDAEFILLCKSVACCPSLILLDLSNWTFKLEWEHSLRAAVQLLQQTGLRELELDSATVLVTLPDGAPTRRGRDPPAAQLARHLPAVRSRVTALGLHRCVLTVNESGPLAGADLLPLVQRLFPRVSTLRLTVRSSATGPTSPAHGGRRSAPLTDGALLRFFRLCGESQLRHLRLGNWRLQLAAPRATLEKKLRPLLGRLLVGQMYLDNVQAVDADEAPCEHLLIVAMVAHLRCLQLLSMQLLFGLQPTQGAAIGRGIRDRFAGETLVLYTAGMQCATLRALRAVVEESDRLRASYDGGPLGVYRISRQVKQARPAPAAAGSGAAGRARLFGRAAASPQPPPR